MTLTAAQIKAVMDAQMGYIDRMYLTAPYGGETCGMLASTAGFPLWIKVSDAGHGVWVGSRKTSYQGVFRWNGAWEERDTGLSATAKATVRDIQVCPQDPRILMLTSDDGVWRTTDEGANWGRVTMPDTRQYYKIAFDTETPGLVLITCQDVLDSGVWSRPKVVRSTQYGASSSFSLISLPYVGNLILSQIQRDTGAIAAHAGKVLVACKGGNTPNYAWPQFWSSTDGGATFADLQLSAGNDDERIAAAPGTPGKFLEINGDQGTLYERQDVAATSDFSNFTYYNNGVPAYPSDFYGHQLVFDGKRNRFWYAVAEKVWYTDDFGANWSYITRTGKTIQGIAVDQQTGAISTTEQGATDAETGVYVSNDGGATFSRLGTAPYLGFAICPAYADYPATGTSIRGLGEYSGKTKEVYSVISGQSGAPGWLGAPADTATSSQFDFGFDLEGDGVGYQGFCGRAIRDYSTPGQITYRIENTATAFSVPSGRKVSVYIGDQEVIPDVAALDPAAWAFEVTTTDLLQNHLRSLDYPARHSFDLGRIVYGARGDTDKAQYFRNSELTTGFDKGLYHIFYGGMSTPYGLYYQWDDPSPYAPVAYKDQTIAMNGDLTDTLPLGIVDDGTYAYPHESKTRAKLFGAPLYPMFLVLTRGTGYTRMQFALKCLQKDINIDREYLDPAFGQLPSFWNPLDTSSQFTTPRKIADRAVEVWEAMDGLGYPNASSDNPYLEAIAGGKASGFTMPQFAIFMTIMGYGLGYDEYQPYADAAIARLRDITWGCAPNDQPGYGVVEGVEFYRPEHQGGIIPVFSEYTVNSLTRYGHAGKGQADKLIDGITFWDSKLPIPLPDALRQGMEMWDGLRQQATDACVVPTTMEATTLAFMAMRVYLRYKHGEAYPAGTSANGLGLLGGGLVKGKVFNGATTPAQPLGGAVVVMVEGEVSAHPTELNRYLHSTAITDENGTFVLPLLSAGYKTFYFFKEPWSEGGYSWWTNYARIVQHVTDASKALGFPTQVLLNAHND